MLVGYDETNLKNLNQSLFSFLLGHLCGEIACILVFINEGPVWIPGRQCRNYVCHIVSGQIVFSTVVRSF